MFAERERAVDERGGDAPAFEGVHLILHQRDQRTDDHGDAFHHQRGELVAERLAAAGGHHHEGVAAAEDGRDDLLLRVEELAETEVLFQQQMGVGRHRG